MAGGERGEEEKGRMMKEQFHRLVTAFVLRAFFKIRKKKWGEVAEISLM